MPGDFQGFESLLSSRLFAQTAQSLELADSEQSRKNLNNKTIGHTVLGAFVNSQKVLNRSKFRNKVRDGKS